MNKPTILLLLMLTLILTACSGSASNATSSAGDAAGELSAPIQVALGTIKLDGTENAVMAAQAEELLPLWETLQVLESSDTSATQEKEALISQIQETMTSEQTQAITALGLSRQEMFSIMQSQALGVGGTQNGTTQSGGTSTNRGSFGPGEANLWDLRLTVTAVSPAAVSICRGSPHSPATLRMAAVSRLPLIPTASPRR